MKLNIDKKSASDASSGVEAVIGQRVKVDVLYQAFYCIAGFQD